MRIIEPSIEILAITPNPLQIIELAGRVCYKSEDKITETSAESFVRGIIKRGHESVLEHASMTVRFIVDRGVSHELVRHRLASFSQESTRYCNYSAGKFGEELTFIEPHSATTIDGLGWDELLKHAEDAYMTQVISYGTKPEDARSMLPNALKTEVIMTANFREWRHVFTLRTSERAHPDMRHIMRKLLTEVRAKVPVVFDDCGSVGSNPVFSAE